MQKYNASGIIKTKEENDNWQKYLKQSKKLIECTTKGKRNQYQTISEDERNQVLAAIDACQKQTFLCNQVKVNMSMQKLVYILSTLANEKKIMRYSVTTRGVRYRKMEVKK
jgi:hypothetical protein